MMDIFTLLKKRVLVFGLCLSLAFASLAQSYCNAFYTNGTFGGNYISLVNIPTTTLNSISGGNTGDYKLFPATGATTCSLIRGNNYSLTVAGGTANDCYIAAWCDWNKNGVFEISEFIGLSPNAGNSSSVNMVGGIKVPFNASLGNVRLRLRTCPINTSDMVYYACGNAFGNYGETEDYTIKINCQFNTSPLAGFNYSDSIFAGSPALLTNNNSNLELNNWYVNNIYDTNTLNLLHTFPTIGSYAICLKSVNCFGSDSACTSVNVYSPTQKPIAAFVASRDTALASIPIKFTDKTMKGPTYWNWSVTPSTGVTFINNTTNNSQNPTINFAIAGVYQVCLWDSNNIGRSNIVCKTILILPSALLCQYPFEATSVSGCITDEGGFNGNYFSSGTCNLLINACADTVFLKFSQFNLTSNSYLRIFDGIDNKAPRLHPGNGFTGTTLPGGSTGLKAGSGKMYLEFEKGIAAPGFNATWTTSPSTMPVPLGTIETPDTADDCGGLYVSKYVSKRIGFNYAEAVFNWDFDYHANAPHWISMKGQSEVAWSYAIPGIYILRLEVENCGGIEILYDTIVVAHPTSGPKTTFKIEPASITVGDTVTLTDITKTPPIWRKWILSGSAGGSIVSGNTFSNTLRVKINSPGNFIVDLMDSNCVGSTTFSLISPVHCIPQVNNLNTLLAIKRIEINNINPQTLDSVNLINQINLSPPTGTVTYRDYTKSMLAKARLGDTLSFKLERSNGSLSEDLKVWIDYNQDGVFQNSELVSTFNNIIGNYFIGGFKIPLNSKTNITRIRFGIISSGKSNLPCGANDDGEFNDFALQISPLIIFPNNTDTFYYEVGRTFTDPGIQVFGATTIQHLGKPFGSVIDLFPSMNLHTIVASDAYNNNMTKKLFAIATKDTTKPVINLIGKDTIIAEAGITYNDLGAIANDFYFGSLTNSIIKNNTVNTNKLGVYYVSYKITDASGNEADSVIRIVIVKDTQAPTIKLNGTDTVIIDVKTLTSVPEPGYLLSDNFYASTSIMVFADYNTVNLNRIGKYIVRYYVSDSSGNSDSSKTRVFNVLDTSAPKIKLIGNSLISWKRWIPYVDPGNIVTDNYDTNLVCIPDTSQIIIQLTGIYRVFFNISDSSGNKAQQVVRYVYVDGIGINQPKENNDLFSIFPNPGSGIFNISIDNINSNASNIEVFDSRGAMVYSQTCYFKERLNTFDLSALPNGLYLVKIINGGNQGTKSIVIQR